MELPSEIIGLTVAQTDYNVFICDADGHDIVEEFLAECVHIRDDRSLWYRPVKFYIAMGSLGMVHAEQIIVYVHSGVIFILSNMASVSGTDYSDGGLGDEGETLVSRLFKKDMNRVSSLGIVPSDTDFFEYAREYCSRNTVMTDGQINHDQAAALLDMNDSLYDGFIHTPGGYLYYVYHVDPTVSESIRYYRNGDKTHQYEYEGNEVLLYGGVPEIMPLGYHCNSFGHMFKVWIPNDIEKYGLGKMIYDSGALPKDLFDLDISEMAEAYALLTEELRRRDDNEAVQMDGSGDGADAEVPLVEELKDDSAQEPSAVL